MKSTCQISRFVTISLITLFFISSCTHQGPTESNTKKEEASAPDHNPIGLNDLGYTDSFGNFKPITLAQLEHFLKKEFELDKSTTFDHALVYNAQEDYHFLHSVSNYTSIGIKLSVKELKDGSKQVFLEQESCVCSGSCQKGCEVVNMCACSSCAQDMECMKTHTIKENTFDLSDFIAD